MTKAASETDYAQLIDTSLLLEHHRWNCLLCSLQYSELAPSGAGSLELVFRAGTCTLHDSTSARRVVVFQAKVVT